MNLSFCRINKLLSLVSKLLRESQFFRVKLNLEDFAFSNVAIQYGKIFIIDQRTIYKTDNIYSNMYYVNKRNM